MGHERVCEEHADAAAHSGPTLLDKPTFVLVVEDVVFQDEGKYSPKGDPVRWLEQAVLFVVAFNNIEEFPIERCSSCDAFIPGDGGIQRDNVCREEAGFLSDAPDS